MAVAAEVVHRLPGPAAVTLVALAVLVLHRP
jgi:hypothetical protein